MAGRPGAGWIGLMAMVTLSACLAEPKAPAILAVPPEPAETTPDLQESVPVTRVVTMYWYEDGATRWSADILRETAGAPGDIKVIGQGSDTRARFFAAKACIEDGGRFDTGVTAFIRNLPSTPGRSFVFEGACR